MHCSVTDWTQNFSENKFGHFSFFSAHLVAFVDVDDGFGRVANNEDNHDSGQERGHGSVPPEYHRHR